MSVESILKSKGVEVFAVGAADTVATAVQMLGTRNVGAVIVKDGDGRVAGILSERDVVRRLSKEGPAVLDRPVSACMTPNPYTCTRATTIDELMAEMTAKRIRHMPVVENGALVGVVSIGDVVKRKIESAEQEAAALKDYIAS